MIIMLPNLSPFNPQKLFNELQNAGISDCVGCNHLGIVWDANGNEIQSRPDIVTILSAHNPTPPMEITFDKAISAPAGYFQNIFVSSPKINPNPELALEEAIAEMEKGEGNSKSIALIALSLAKYLKSKKNKLK